MVALARRGGLNGDGGNQRGAKNGESLLHGVFSRDDVPAVRHVFIVVAADMAMRPTEYQQRWLHDGASKFFGPG